MSLKSINEAFEHAYGKLNENGRCLGSAIAYGWFVWEKGFTGEPRIRWFN